ENEPYVEQAPQNPSKSFMGSAAMFTDARPTMRPALVNSVICCGRSAPRGFLSRSYQPHPFSPSKSFAKPAMFVESARSAEHAMNNGRPYLFFAYVLTHAPHVASAARFGCFSPGFL